MLQVTNNLKTSINKGFTLIELLVVISIIGLLASVVLVALNSARAKSRDGKRVSDMNQMAKALELFFNDASAYPTGSYTTNSVFGQYILAATAPSGATINMTPTYITKIPTAPTPQDGTCSSSQNTYMYQSNTAGTTYTITFCLGAAVGGSGGGLGAGVRRLTPGGFQ